MFKYFNKSIIQSPPQLPISVIIWTKYLHFNINLVFFKGNEYANIQ